MTDAARSVARALFREARAAAELEPVEADLARLARLTADRDVQRFLDHPRIPLADKVRVLAPAVSNGLARRLLGALLAARETGLLPAIHRGYAGLLKRETGFVDTVARVARPLTPAEEAELRVAVRKATGLAALLKVQVDPTLIAGVRLAIDGRIVDNSFRTGLERLKEKLLTL
jgi:F-type H+-transporting ATPase subunit delta